MKEQFKRDVDQGLSSSPKTLPSKYFYDKKGWMIVDMKEDWNRIFPFSE